MGPMMSLDPNIYAVGEPELLRTWPSFRRTADLTSGVEEIECGRMRWGLWFGPLVSAEHRRSPAALMGLEEFKRGAVARYEVALC